MLVYAALKVLAAGCIALEEVVVHTLLEATALQGEEVIQVVALVVVT